MKLNDRIAALQGEYQKLVDRHEQARKDAEKDRDTAQASKEEAVKAKEQELNVRGQKIEELQANVQAKDQEMNGFRDQMMKKTSRLEMINKGLAPSKTRSSGRRSRLPVDGLNSSIPIRTWSGSTAARPTL